MATIAEARRKLDRLNRLLGTDLQVKRDTLRNKGWRIGGQFYRSKDEIICDLGLVCQMVENNDWTVEKAKEAFK